MGDDTNVPFIVRIKCMHGQVLKQSKTSLLVIIAPVTEARNPTLTAMREITLPCLCLCSITNINTPAAPWTNRDEKRAHRKIQYHISEKKSRGLIVLLETT